MTQSELTSKIKSLAFEIGFDKVGITAPELSTDRERDLAEWLDRGYAGEMHYMTRDGLKRARPREILEDARSVVALALSYAHRDDPKPAGEHGGPSARGFVAGKVARYARGRDYHRVIEKKLKRLSRAIEEAAGPGASVKGYVDTGPIMEKAFAERAGIGFYGKNTNILTPDLGSWIFLASLVTNLELDHDGTAKGGCGSCRLCIDACPTEALEPYRIDARKCISHWTIETRGEIPANIADRMGEWVFGCDICQEVCPFNRKPKPSREEDFSSRAGRGMWIDVRELLGLDEEGFREFARGTALKRPKREGFLRNARVVLENKLRVKSEE